MVARNDVADAASGAGNAPRCLMVLGAGPAQVPGIEKAVAAGHRVVTVDPYPDSPGHALAHASVHCDTRDLDSVREAAAALRVDGVCTFRSDVATLTVHRLREGLGLPGGHARAAEVMGRKNAFREFQRASGLPFPAFVHGRDALALSRRAEGLGPLVFCKPADNCASRGVSRIADVNRTRLEAAVAHAKAWSRSGTVCLEAGIAGVEVGGDALFAGGALVFAGITRKCLEGVVVRGHRLPCGLSEADERRIEAALASTCALLGYRDGPLNFDVMVSEDAVTIIEMSPRNGGNGIADLVRHAFAVDVEAHLIELALGRTPALPARTLAGGFGVVVLGASRAGRLRCLPTLRDWQSRSPNVVELFYGRHRGDDVDALQHGGNAVGHMVFSCRDGEEFERTRRELAGFDLLA